MKPKVYVETSVISYLTARPSRDIVVAGHQQVTQEWWQTCQERFEIVISELVAPEASVGDPDASQRRMAALAGLALLTVDQSVSDLAQTLVDAYAVPAQAARDAVHLATAVINAADYLVTWNFRHLANAARRTVIEEVCRAAGFEPVIICTPEELLET